MILLNPGPVNVSPRVRKALLRPDICHREEEFSVLLQQVREKLLQAFAPSDEYTAIVLTGSGTAAVEAAISSCLEPDKKILILNNGVYGERMSRMALSYGMNIVELKFPWQERLELSRIEQVLSGEPAIQVVAMVHHETTTGMINPIREISDLTSRYGKRLVVDSVSGLGGEALNLSRHRIDLCIGSAGKCIQGYPGLSFVLVRREEMSRIQKIKPRSLYLSLSGNFKEQEKGTVPFTPAVQLYYAFDEALTELLDEGVDGRIARYRAASRLLREGFSKLGLKFLLPEELRSNTITSLYLPAGKKYHDLHDRMKEKGFVIYAGQGVLQADVFRVANMGQIKRSDFKKFLLHLGKILK